MNTQTEPNEPTDSMLDDPLYRTSESDNSDAEADDPCAEDDFGDY